ncbi:MAG: hypothetical protein CMJ75_19260 [Planctomycetaceae bacterium]|nr:hypothetical protein [Planctomycetaceae bacterium]
MSSFTSFSAPLNIEYDVKASRLLGADHWRVTETFRYMIGGLDSGRWVTVPAGYLTDGASVPRLLWSRLPPWGHYGQAAAVHDILCESLTIVENGQPVRITRREADRVLAEAMEVLGVDPATRRAISLGVAVYRVVARPLQPSWNSAKRALESEWRGYRDQAAV